jgi:hypothetical protein
MAGTIAAKRPRVRGLEQRFESRLLPMFVRRTEQVAELLLAVTLIEAGTEYLDERPVRACAAALPAAAPNHAHPARGREFPDRSNQVMALAVSVGGRVRPDFRRV